MDRLKRNEKGVSEVVGAVLLVSIVVIGGAAVAAMVFGQPAPKEVPKVSFVVSLNASEEELTLHHTGGDTLQAPEYGVIWYDTNGIAHYATEADTSLTWSSDGDLVIHDVDQQVGFVVLSYKDPGGGDTVLRRVPFEDAVLRGMISGTKWNVTDGVHQPLNGVTITISRKVGSDFIPAYSTTTGSDGIPGHYSYTLPAGEWGVYKVEEDLTSLPGTWDPVNPPHGSRQVTVSETDPFKVLDFENRLVPVPTTKTPKPTETITTTPTLTTTPTPVIPIVPITGTKYRVDEMGVVIDTVANFPIILEQLVGSKWVFVASTVTDANGLFTFSVPDVPGTYRVREVNPDPKYWYFWNPVDGIINGVVPGGSGYDFLNYRVPADGVVMFLNKTVNETCPGGYVVDGTTIVGEARGGDTVSFEINGIPEEYRFNAGEQFRFTIAGDQYEGEFLIEQFAMTKLSFDVRFEVRPKGSNDESAWTTPTSSKFNKDKQVVVGSPTAVSITAINKNILNPSSTLAYRHPICSDNETLLRLNGQVRIDSPSDDTYLEFTNLHEVHDERYHEDHNVIWIYLNPDRDLILAQGVCVSP